MAGSFDGNKFYVSDFDEQLEQNIILPMQSEIERQSELRDGYIDVHITSYGGNAPVCYHLVEMFEIAKRNDVVVRTIVPNTAFSAGSMLAVAGSTGHRYIARTAEHLVHYGAIGSFETTPAQIERFTKWKDRVFKGHLKHYKKYCSIPDIDQEMLDDGFFVPAPQAIKWKLADHYLDKMPLVPDFK